MRQADSSKDPEVPVKTASIWKERLRLYKRNILSFWTMYRDNKMGLLGFGIILFFVGVAVFAPVLAPYDPWEMKVTEPFSSPTWEHPLGGDDMGKDILSQIIVGSRISLLVGFLAAISTTMLGVFIGLASGYFMGILDNILMRITDIVLILPSIPLMILFAAYLGSGIWNIIFVIAITSWTSTARMVRSQTLSLREEAFVEAARAIGVSDTHIIISHILPNVIPLILANTVLTIVSAVIAEAGLSFLGLGDPLHQSWGMILYYAQTCGGFLRGAWWWIITPGVCITIVGLGFTFIGYSLDEIFNPRLRQR